MKHIGLLVVITFATPTANANTKAFSTVLLSHPRAATLRHYLGLSRHHLLDHNLVHLRGFYHDSETENYQDAVDLLRQEHIDWIELVKIHCPLGPTAVYQHGACRAEFTKLVRGADGIIFNGGPDIPPSLYNTPQLLTTQIEHQERIYFEIAFLANLLGTARNRSLAPLLPEGSHMPILGLCMGMQLMNVADGGSLIQDIPSEIYQLQTVEQVENFNPSNVHANYAYAREPNQHVAYGVVHPIVLTENVADFLQSFRGASPLLTLSVHHQAVKTLAPDYIVTARSLDGRVVEGIRHKKYPLVMGWQFHPERSEVWDKEQNQRATLMSSENNAIFSAIASHPTSEAFNAAIWHYFTQQVHTFHLAQQRVKL